MIVIYRMILLNIVDEFIVEWGLELNVKLSWKNCFYNGQFG